MTLFIGPRRNLLLRQHIHFNPPSRLNLTSQGEWIDEDSAEQLSDELEAFREKWGLDDCPSDEH